jgi:hypothetical protein
MTAPWSTTAGTPRTKKGGGGHISAEDFSRIIRKIDEIGFFALKDRYRSVEVGGEEMFMTDQPTLTISVIANGQTKSVEDYLGAPKRLKELEELIYKVTGLSSWLGSAPDLSDIPTTISFLSTGHSNFVHCWSTTKRRATPGEYRDTF